MRWKRYGLKIDMTGITKKQVAEVLAGYFQSKYTYNKADDSYDIDLDQKNETDIANAESNESFDSYSIQDRRERLWKIETNKDIKPEKVMRDKRMAGNFFYQTRLVTPLMYKNDFKAVKDVVELLEQIGALTNETTKLTVELETTGLKSKDKYIKNLDNIYQSKGRLLDKILDTGFTSIAETKRLREEGIVSFPIYKSTLNLETILSYVQLSQAISDHADTNSIRSGKENPSPNDKFVMRTWLVRIGMTGKEYDFARKMLTKDLYGNSAWLHRIDVEEVQPGEMLEKETAQSLEWEEPAGESLQEYYDVWEEIEKNQGEEPIIVFDDASWDEMKETGEEPQHRINLNEKVEEAQQNEVADEMGLSSWDAIIDIVRKDTESDVLWEEIKEAQEEEPDIKPNNIFTEEIGEMQEQEPTSEPHDILEETEEPQTEQSMQEANSAPEREIEEAWIIKTEEIEDENISWEMGMDF